MIRVTVELLPGGDAGAACVIGTMHVHRRHAAPHPVSLYDYRLETKGKGRIGTGVAHRREDDVFALLRHVLNHNRNPATDPLPTPTLFADPLPDPAQAGVTVARYAPQASREAARMAYPRSGTQRMRVLDLVAHRRDAGATDEEMQVRLGLGHNSQTPRRRELVLGGWIEDSGETRPTGSTGAQATVWVLTAAGRREWEAHQ